MTASGPVDGGLVTSMQAYEDAICWRTGKLAEPCPDCIEGAEVWCTEHAIDLHLIVGYKLAISRLASKS